MEIWCWYYEWYRNETHEEPISPNMKVFQVYGPNPVCSTMVSGCAEWSGDWIYQYLSYMHELGWTSITWLRNYLSSSQSSIFLLKIHCIPHLQLIFHRLSHKMIYGKCELVKSYFELLESNPLNVPFTLNIARLNINYDLTMNIYLKGWFRENW